MTQDLAGLLRDAVTAVEQARSLPLSGSAVVDRQGLLSLLHAAEDALPHELAQARQVLAERDAVLADAREQAVQLLDQARVESDHLVSATAVHAAAAEEAARIVEEARETARTMQVEADDYVDGRLATMEIALHRTLESVQRGRARLAGRSALDDLSALDDDAPPGLR